MASKKKPKPRKVYTITYMSLGKLKESRKMWSRKHDAAIKAQIEKGVLNEYELVKTGEYLIVGNNPIEYVERTEEAKLLYE